MKKILFIVNLDKFFVSHRLPIAISLLENGYEVHIASKFTENENRLKNLGFITHNLPIKRTSTGIASNLLTFLKIFKLFKCLKPDLIHLITIKPIIFGGICSYFFKEIPIVSSVSGLGFVFSDEGQFSRFRKNIVLLLYKLALNSTKQIVIFQNKDDREILLKKTNLKKQDTRLIHGSGVDLNTFSVNPKEQKKPIVLFAGRLLISKGVIDFIESSKYTKNVRYVISGEFDNDNPDCIDENLLDKKIKKGYVEYWGYNKNIADIINESSIVILPSYYGEGLPKILIEAAACGKPIITTNHPGCRDAIIENITGLLVPIKSPISIAKAINKIIDNDDIRISMGRKGRIFAEKNFSIDNVVLKHLEIYRYLIY